MTLDEIDALCKAATPGPWNALIGHHFSRCHAIGPNHYRERDGTLVIAEKNANADAAFIAASRTLMPKLLEVAKAAKAVCDEAGKACAPDSKSRVINAPWICNQLVQVLEALESTEGVG